jgi:3-phenylpropionate/cinnamic acid dioxygenase small subunit
MEQVEAIKQASAVPAQGKIIPFGEPVYNQIMQFLIEEAYLLDDGHFKEWLALLEDDMMLTMPVRQTLSRKRGDGSAKSSYWLFDDKEALVFKAERYLGDSAWADDPPSRLRRLITNLRVQQTEHPNEYLAQSYLLLQRSTSNQHQFVPFSARRDDILRKTAQGWRIARRNLQVDQAVIGQANLGFVL